MKYHYLELKEGEKVIRRVPTSLSSEYNDRRRMEYFKSKNQKIFLVISSTKEKVIN